MVIVYFHEDFMAMFMREILFMDDWLRVLAGFFSFLIEVVLVGGIIRRKLAPAHQLSIHPFNRLYRRALRRYKISIIRSLIKSGSLHLFILLLILNLRLKYVIIFILLLVVIKLNTS